MLLDHIICHREFIGDEFAVGVAAAAIKSGAPVGAAFHELTCATFGRAFNTRRKSFGVFTFRKACATNEAAAAAPFDDHRPLAIRTRLFNRHF